MIRVVLDTNVVVCALISSAGFEDRVLKLGLHIHVQLYISPPLLAEYEKRFIQPKARPQQIKRSFYVKVFVPQPTP